MENVLSFFFFFFSPGLPPQPPENCDVPVYKTDLERMQGFFTTVYDFR